MSTRPQPIHILQTPLSQPVEVKGKYELHGSREEAISNTTWAQIDGITEALLREIEQTNEMDPVMEAMQSIRENAIFRYVLELSRHHSGEQKNRQKYRPVGPPLLRQHQCTK